MRLVLALGGNALIPRGRPLDFAVQQASARGAAHSLAPIVAAHDVVITHGNGPQVGLLALQSESYTEVASYPLDVLVAESEGMIGYILETELDQLVDRPILTVLTRTVVDPADPAFDDPSKPIGPMYRTLEAARRLSEGRGWEFVVDGQEFRRVVPSPNPVRIVQSPLIQQLLDLGVLVVCAGGGGIPVVEIDGGTRGVEAVVDKDLASALLAIELDVDALVCLTDVEGVYDSWGRPGQRLIRQAPVEWFRDQEFAVGSMGPKVEAACRFVEVTGRSAYIGALEQVGEILSGTAGTLVQTAMAAIESRGPI